jgi:hypothetical protein
MIKPVQALLFLALGIVAGAGLTAILLDSPSGHVPSAVAIATKDAELAALRTQQQALTNEIKELRSAVSSNQATTAVRGATASPVAEAAHNRPRARSDSPGQGATADGTESTSTGAGSPGAGGGAGGPMASATATQSAASEIAKQQQIAMLDTQYGPLFSQFQLSEPEKANFKQLLAERINVDGEIARIQADTTLTPEQRIAELTKLAKQKETTANRIKTFLNNPTDYNAFQTWEETKPDRNQFNLAHNIFASSPEPLSADQQNQFLRTLSEVRAGYNRQYPDGLPSNGVTTAEVDRQLARLDAQSAMIRQRAASFMTPGQLQTLGTQQAQYRSLIQASLNMTLLMQQRQK